MNTAADAPLTTAQIMNLLVREPGRPRLTWYGDDGERVELSGAVLVNWVSKTSNLLVEELDSGPGRRALIDLPVHWRTAVWVLGALRTGATVVLPGPDGLTPDDQPVDVTVTTRPAGRSGDVIAVTLPALARRFDGDLPPGAIDAAGAVMTYADTVVWAPETDPGEPAIVAPAETAPAAEVSHAQLFAWASPTPQGPGTSGQAPVRLLLDGRMRLLDALRSMLGVWACGGSVVLTSPSAAAALEADPQRRTRLMTQERITTSAGR